jgi:hypothetical protein
VRINPALVTSTIFLSLISLSLDASAYLTLSTDTKEASKPSYSISPLGDQSASGNPENEQNLSPSLVKLSIVSSRPEVTRNHGWGLTADIANISLKPITIFGKEVQLVMQPEETHDKKCNVAFDSFLPNTTSDRKTKGDPPMGPDDQIIIQPGEHYAFFWSGVDSTSQPGRNNECDRGFLSGFGETLNFIPGNYVFTVVGKLHPAGSSNYHTFSDAISVKISIDQLSTMLFAGFGAILAYMIVALQDNGDIDNIKEAASRKAWIAATLIFGRKVISAFLLGSILAVVSNRLSDTQFPIKVSVNDVWGALTVGFVFYFVGSKIIDKLKTLGPSTA